VDNDQLKEFVRCHGDFAHFCENHVKVRTPTGVVPLKLFDHQRRLAEQLNETRFTIVPQPRQWGFTTSTGVWLLWKCMFHLDQRCMLLTSSDKAAIKACEIVRFALEQLPEWMKPSLGRNNQHEVSFPETGGHLSFYMPEASKGRALNWLVLDNAAFIPQMEQHWKAMWPVLSCGGSCLVQSCIGPIEDEKNWFNQTLRAAMKGENAFKPFLPHPPHQAIR